ncbi:hypothetical protein FB45DRAFT_974086 [Roridomyces roridus]|uniref:Uncharacterized protein n=1 Tax=Roridomyces roridus TaxID=1738132 RepID=A0AAD7CIB1_9AGAR|nr:hypothetical protein FB45DRAFT_974086 [Roridomyces roridus]
MQTAHRTYTTNGAQAYSSTLSPTLDAFQQLTGYAYSSQINTLLSHAWAEDPELTLRIVWNLRSIHDGKSERDAFYRAFGWLWDNHPRTAIVNLHLLVEPVCLRATRREPNKEAVAHGYWKDLLNILALATVDELSSMERPAAFLHIRSAPAEVRARKETMEPADVAAANHRQIKRKLADPKYRALYIAIARLFSARLLADLQILRESEKAADEKSRRAILHGISLASKWAPSLAASHDRQTNIATAIAHLLYHDRGELIFPSALATVPSLDSIEATVLLRSYYRRWVLVPLRTASVVIERYMTANRWKEIPYSRVSAVCMKTNKERFFKHDPVGFQSYLISVEKGRRTISGATLLPHQLVGEICDISREARYSDREQYPELARHKSELAAIQVRVLEAQWKRLVGNLREAGAIENSIAICDVSAHFPAVALSLVLAQLAKPPFNSGFITFSEHPEFVRLDPALSLQATIDRMGNSAWGGTTNLNAVFMRLILPLAIENRIKPEDMIKRLFVFSDMQFDQATSGTLQWETNYNYIERAYRAEGYEVPQIVFWDLGGYGTTEVLAERSGVALMSGFSPSMLKVFMGEQPDPETEMEDAEWVDVAEVEPVQQQDVFNPVSVMKKALSRECYAGLVVVD